MKKRLNTHKKVSFWSQFVSQSTGVMAIITIFGAGVGTSSFILNSQYYVAETKLKTDHQNELLDQRMKYEQINRELSDKILKLEIEIYILKDGKK